MKTETIVVVLVLVAAGGLVIYMVTKTPSKSGATGSGVSSGSTNIAGIPVPTALVSQLKGSNLSSALRTVGSLSTAALTSPIYVGEGAATALGKAGKSVVSTASSAVSSAYSEGKKITSDISSTISSWF
jgi:hypothetical protein